MPVELYCTIDGVQHGPISPRQLRQLALDGKLKPSDPVWRSGTQTRVPASTIRGLFDGVLAPYEAEVAELDVVEEVEEVEPQQEHKPRKKEKKKDKPEVLAEMSVTYREGLPDVAGPLLATLYVEATGLRFEFDEVDFCIAFAKVENVLKPARGDFPQAMKKKALAAKVGGKAGKLAAGLLGKMIGGDAGEAVAKVGGGAGNMAEGMGELGKPPRNRITVIARLRQERCKVYFDANGVSTQEMNEEARLLFEHIQKARDKFSGGAGVVPSEEAPIPLSEPEPSSSSGSGPAGQGSSRPSSIRNPQSAIRNVHAAVAGKPFRVMSGGRIQGPFSLGELRQLLGSGKLGGNDLIGVETWLPLSTLGGLLGAEAPAEAGAEDEEVYEDFEVVEDDEAEKAGASPKRAEESGGLHLDEPLDI
jgi:hypothetical protein